MLGTHFYNEAIRKTVVGFGTLFNNIEIKLRDPSNSEILEVQKVPISYGPRDKFVTRLEQNPDPTPGEPYEYMRIPRMYFEMTGIRYDGARKTSPVQKYRTVIEDNGNELREQYVPVPYNMSFELGILSKSTDNALQTLEQILPYFQPNFNITINFIPDMEESRDVAVVMDGINYSDTWTGDYKSRRSIIWTLQFTVKSYIYGPFNQSKSIRTAIIRENIGNKSQSLRSADLTYKPVALTDIDGNNVVEGTDGTGPDDLLLTPADDFGFSSDIDEYL